MDLAPCRSPVAVGAGAVAQQIVGRVVGVGLRRRAVVRLRRQPAGQVVGVGVVGQRRPRAVEVLDVGDPACLMLGFYLTVCTRFSVIILMPLSSNPCGHSSACSI